jgi:hypothetical protein
MASEAFCDESFEEAEQGGFYVLAAALVDVADQVMVREVMRDMNGVSRKTKMHWRDMNSRQRRSVARQLADIPATYVVAVGAPVPPKRQERARVACLRAVATELQARTIEVIHLEKRTRTLDLRDIQTIVGMRYILLKKSTLVLRHRGGNDEPLMWLADVAAGAVRADRLGASDYLPPLGDRVYEIAVSTDC